MIPKHGKLQRVVSAKNAKRTDSKTKKPKVRLNLWPNQEDGPDFSSVIASLCKSENMVTMVSGAVVLCCCAVSSWYDLTELGNFDFTKQMLKPPDDQVVQKSEWTSDLVALPILDVLQSLKNQHAPPVRPQSTSGGSVGLDSDKSDDHQCNGTVNTGEREQCQQSVDDYLASLLHEPQRIPRHLLTTDTPRRHPPIDEPTRPAQFHRHSPETTVVFPAEFESNNIQIDAMPVSKSIPPATIKSPATKEHYNRPIDTKNDCGLPICIDISGRMY